MHTQIIRDLSALKVNTGKPTLPLLQWSQQQMYCICFNFRIWICLLGIVSFPNMPALSGTSKQQLTGCFLLCKKIVALAPIDIALPTLVNMLLCENYDAEAVGPQHSTPHHSEGPGDPVADARPRDRIDQTNDAGERQPQDEDHQVDGLGDCLCRMQNGLGEMQRCDPWPI